MPYTLHHHLSKIERKDLYELAGKKHAITLHPPTSGANGAAIKKHYVNDEIFYILNSLDMTYGSCGLCEFFLMTGLIAQGPKLFRPDQTSCESLENMDLNIRFDDYMQPFPFFVIEFPENYVKNRVADCPQGGKYSLLGGSYVPEAHQPAFTIVHYDTDKKIIVLGTYFTSGQCCTRYFSKSCFASDEAALEEAIKLHNMEEKDRGSLETSKAEEEIAQSTYRIALNACLLLTSSGCKTKGPSESSVHKTCSRTVQRLKTSKLPLDKAKVKIAREQLKCVPTEYVLDQNVKVYDTELALPERTTTESSGNTVRPHWRRGHWRKQPFGPKSSQRKLIAVKPVLVNKNLLSAVAKTNQTTVYHK